MFNIFVNVAAENNNKGHSQEKYKKDTDYRAQKQRKTLQHRKRYQEKRATFNKHINRVPEHWLAKRLMDWVKNLKATTNWQKKNLQGDLKSARITDTDIKDRHTYRRKIREW